MIFNVYKCIQYIMTFTKGIEFSKHLNIPFFPRLLRNRIKTGLDGLTRQNSLPATALEVHIISGRESVVYKYKQKS